MNSQSTHVQIAAASVARADTHIASRRDTVRILFILDRAGSPVKRGAPANAVKIIDAEKKMQALDFWVRNPDYLAHELLDQFDASGRTETKLFAQAKLVMQGDEPEIRRLAMLRFLFGAWEALDDAMATLTLLGLAFMQRKYDGSGSRIMQTSFYLTADGAAKAEELASVPPLSWYAERASLVAQVANNRTGTALKKRQYEIAEYHDARYNRLIQPIREQITARLVLLGASA